MAAFRYVSPKAMTKAELAEFRKTASLFTTRVLEIEFRQAIQKLSVRPLPSPRLMQTIVTYWRELQRRTGNRHASDRW